MFYFYHYYYDKITQFIRTNRIIQSNYKMCKDCYLLCHKTIKTVFFGPSNWYDKDEALAREYVKYKLILGEKVTEEDWEYNPSRISYLEFLDLEKRVVKLSSNIFPNSITHLFLNEDTDNISLKSILYSPVQAYNELIFFNKYFKNINKENMNLISNYRSMESEEILGDVVISFFRYIVNNTLKLFIDYKILDSYHRSFGSVDFISDISKKDIYNIDQVSHYYTGHRHYFDKNNSLDFFLEENWKNKFINNINNVHLYIQDNMLYSDIYPINKLDDYYSFYNYFLHKNMGMNYINYNTLHYTNSKLFEKMIYYSDNSDAYLKFLEKKYNLNWLMIDIDMYGKNYYHTFLNPFYNFIFNKSYNRSSRNRNDSLILAASFSSSGGSKAKKKYFKRGPDNIPGVPKSRNKLRTLDYERYQKSKHLNPFVSYKLKHGVNLTSEKRSKLTHKLYNIDNHIGINYSHKYPLLYDLRNYYFYMFKNRYDLNQYKNNNNINPELLGSVYNEDLGLRHNRVGLRLLKKIQFFEPKLESDTNSIYFVYLNKVKDFLNRNKLYNQLNFKSYDNLFFYYMNQLTSKDKNYLIDLYFFKKNYIKDMYNRFNFTNIGARSGGNLIKRIISEKNRYFSVGGSSNIPNEVSKKTFNIKLTQYDLLTRLKFDFLSKSGISFNNLFKYSNIWTSSSTDFYLSNFFNIKDIIFLFISSITLLGNVLYNFYYDIDAILILLTNDDYLYPWISPILKNVNNFWYNAKFFYFDYKLEDLLCNSYSVDTLDSTDNIYQYKYDHNFFTIKNNYNEFNNLVNYIPTNSLFNSNNYFYNQYYHHIYQAKGVIKLPCFSHSNSSVIYLQWDNQPLFDLTNNMLLNLLVYYDNFSYNLVKYDINHLILLLLSDIYFNFFLYNDFTSFNYIYYSFLEFISLVFSIFFIVFNKLFTISSPWFFIFFIKFNIIIPIELLDYFTSNLIFLNLKHLLFDMPIFFCIDFINYNFFHMFYKIHSKNHSKYLYPNFYIPLWYLYYYIDTYLPTYWIYPFYNYYNNMNCNPNNISEAIISMCGLIIYYLLFIPLCFLLKIIILSLFIEGYAIVIILGFLFYYHLVYFNNIKRSAWIYSNFKKNSFRKWLLKYGKVHDMYLNTFLSHTEYLLPYLNRRFQTSTQLKEDNRRNYHMDLDNAIFMSTKSNSLYNKDHHNHPGRYGEHYISNKLIDYLYNQSFVDLSKSYNKNKNKNDFYNEILFTNKYLKLKSKINMGFAKFPLFGSYPNHVNSYARKGIYNFSKFIPSTYLFNNREDFFIPFILIGKHYYDQNYIYSKKTTEFKLSNLIRGLNLINEDKYIRFYYLSYYFPFYARLLLNKHDYLDFTDVKSIIPKDPLDMDFEDILNETTKYNNHDWDDIMLSDFYAGSGELEVENSYKIKDKNTNILYDKKRPIKNRAKFRNKIYHNEKYYYNSANVIPFGYGDYTFNRGKKQRFLHSDYLFNTRNQGIEDETKYEYVVWDGGAHTVFLMPGLASYLDSSIQYRLEMNHKVLYKEFKEYLKSPKLFPLNESIEGYESHLGDSYDLGVNYPYNLFRESIDMVNVLEKVKKFIYSIYNPYDPLIYISSLAKKGFHRVKAAYSNDQEHILVDRLNYIHSQVDSKLNRPVNIFRFNNLEYFNKKKRFDHRFYYSNFNVKNSEKKYFNMDSYNYFTYNHKDFLYGPTVLFYKEDLMWYINTLKEVKFLNTNNITWCRDFDLGDNLSNFYYENKLISNNLLHPYYYYPVSYNMKSLYKWNQISKHHFSKYSDIERGKLFYWFYHNSTFEDLGNIDIIDSYLYDNIDPFINVFLSFYNDIWDGSEISKILPSTKNMYDKSLYMDLDSMFFNRFGIKRRVTKNSYLASKIYRNKYLRSVELGKYYRYMRYRNTLMNDSIDYNKYNRHDNFNDTSFNLPGSLLPDARLDFIADSVFAEVDSGFIRLFNFIFFRTYVNNYISGKYSPEPIQKVGNVQGTEALLKSFMSLDKFSNYNLYSSFFMEMNEFSTSIYHNWASQQLYTNLYKNLNKKIINFKHFYKYRHLLGNFAYSSLYDTNLFSTHSEENIIMDRHNYFKYRKGLDEVPYTLDNVSNFYNYDRFSNKKHSNYPIYINDTSIDVEILTTFTKIPLEKHIVFKHFRSKGSTIFGDDTSDFYKLFLEDPYINRAYERNRIRPIHVTESFLENKENLHNKLLNNRIISESFDHFFNSVRINLDIALLKIEPMYFYKVPPELKNRWIEYQEYLTYYKHYDNNILNNLKENIKNTYGGSWKYYYFKYLLSTEEYDYIFEKTLNNTNDSNINYELLKTYCDKNISGALLTKDFLIYKEKIKSISPNSSLFFYDFYPEYAWEYYEFDWLEELRSDWILFIAAALIMATMLTGFVYDNYKLNSGRLMGNYYIKRDSYTRNTNFNRRKKKLFPVPKRLKSKRLMYYRLQSRNRFRYNPLATTHAKDKLNKRLVEYHDVYSQHNRFKFSYDNYTRRRDKTPFSKSFRMKFPKKHVFYDGYISHLRLNKRRHIKGSRIKFKGYRRSFLLNSLNMRRKGTDSGLTYRYATIFDKKDMYKIVDIQKAEKKFISHRMRSVNPHRKSHKRHHRRHYSFDFYKMMLYSDLIKLFTAIKSIFIIIFGSIEVIMSSLIKNSYSFTEFKELIKYIWIYKYDLIPGLGYLKSYIIECVWPRFRYTIYHLLSNTNPYVQPLSFKYRKRIRKVWKGHKRNFKDNIALAMSIEHFIFHYLVYPIFYKIYLPFTRLNNYYRHLDKKILKFTSNIFYDFYIIKYILNSKIYVHKNNFINLFYKIIFSLFKLFKFSILYLVKLFMLVLYPILYPIIKLFFFIINYIIYTTLKMISKFFFYSQCFYCFYIRFHKRYNIFFLPFRYITIIIKGITSIFGSFLYYIFKQIAMIIMYVIIYPIIYFFKCYYSFIHFPIFIKFYKDNIKKLVYFLANLISIYSSYLNSICYLIYSISYYSYYIFINPIFHFFIFFFFPIITNISFILGRFLFLYIEPLIFNYWTYCFKIKLFYNNLLFNFIYYIKYFIYHILFPAYIFINKYIFIYINIFINYIINNFLTFLSTTLLMLLKLLMQPYYILFIIILLLISILTTFIINFIINITIFLLIFKYIFIYIFIYSLTFIFIIIYTIYFIFCPFIYICFSFFKFLIIIPLFFYKFFFIYIACIIHIFSTGLECYIEYIFGNNNNYFYFLSLLWNDVIVHNLHYIYNITFKLIYQFVNFYFFHYLYNIFIDNILHIYYYMNFSLVDLKEMFIYIKNKLFKI